MSQRVLDEREHRRGLVLGLTLAEVLILLLFLLLLGLGAGLAKSYREVRAARDNATRLEDEIAEYQRRLDELGVQLPPGQTHRRLSDVERDKAALEKQLAEIKKQLGHAEPMLRAAKRINPDDPPAALRIFGRVTESLTVEDIKSISRMSPDDKIIVKAFRRSTEDVPSNGEHDWPPIISLNDASGYFFEPGSATPSAEFRSKLSGSVVAQMINIIEKFKVDVIEVVGHTDEQPVYTKPPIPPGFKKRDEPSPLDSIPRKYGRYPNLDATLIRFLNGEEELENVVPFDNAGLGLARAAAVARILLQDDRLRKFRILPLSAGQLILVGDRLSPGSRGDIKERRRIEIRMRRLDTLSK